MEAFFGLVAEKVVLALGSEALKAIGYVTKSQGLQLSEVNEMMRRIRSEFEHMQTFISNVDLHKYSATIQPWVKRAREIGENMEDVIDQYLYLSAEQSQAATLYYPFDRCYIIGSNPWSDIGIRLKKIESALAHLKEMKERYDITKLESGEPGSSAAHLAAGRKEFIPTSLDTASEDGITLFASERQELMQWLTDNKTETAVIVVWGMGGLGKTTLVENVYKSDEIDKHFDCKAWVTVSSKYDPDELLMRLLSDLESINHLPFLRGYMPDRYTLIQRLKNILEDERYLLVLDDVWTQSAFMELKKSFPDDELRSRVVITTRLPEIAEMLASKDRIMPLSKLDQDQAWRLFCREAFGKRGTDAYPTALKETGRDIVNKCDGLPLAIVAIARVMSLKQKTYVEWKRVVDKLSWEFSNNSSLESVKHVLNLSFDDLPSYLKNCFLYCTVFLASSIERNKLIKLWVAESFIQDRGSQTREEVAEDFFDELVHRSMLHVVERNRYGKVRRCRIPELVRNITLSTAWKERFSTVWKESEPSQLGEDARRLSVHQCTTKQSILFKMDFSRIRSLFIFDYNSSTEELFNSVSSTARYLRVIDLENAEISKIPSALTGLFNLHYLGLRGTKVKRLPRSIGKLRNMQTLDVRYTNVEKLPKGVSQLKNLRHLLNKVYDDSRRGTMHSYRFLRSPHSVWNLRSLQELSMAVDEATVSRLGNLTALRILKVSNVKQSHHRNLCISLSLMPSLYKLSIIAADESEVLRLVDLAPLFKNLHKLHLHGRLAEPDLPVPQTTGLKLLFSRITLGSGGATPPRPAPREVMQQMGAFASKDYSLRGLCLSWCGLKDDPLPMISNLRNLTVLKLKDTSDTVELRFGERWFPELKELHLLKFKHLNKIIVEKEALKSLEVWAMVGLSELMVLPKGIEFLKALGHLSITECNPFFLYEIKGDHKHSVDHIQRIEHKYQVDGKWISESLTQPSAAVPTHPVLSKPQGAEIQPQLQEVPDNCGFEIQPQGAEIQPQLQEVPDNRVLSASIRKTKSYSQLPNLASSFPAPNLHDLMNLHFPFPIPNSLARVVRPTARKSNSDSSIQESEAVFPRSSHQSDPHERRLVDKTMSSDSLNSNDHGQKCPVDPMLDELENNVRERWTPTEAPC